MKIWSIFAVGCILFFTPIVRGENNVEAERTEIALKASPVSVSVDFKSKHLWRGFASGETFSIEPNITWKVSPRFSFSAWGGYCPDNSFREIDLYATYSIANFSVTLFDYYCPASGDFFDGRVVDFDASETEHLIDLRVDYKLKKLPVSFAVSTMLFGNDRDEESGENLYSTYCEAIYMWKRGKLAVDFIAGYTLFKGMYAEKANFVNLVAAAGYPVKLGKNVKSSVKGIVTNNPEQGKTYLTLGLNMIL